MVDKEVLQRKLQKMQEYLDEIDYYKEITWSEYKGNNQIRRAVERLIQLIVDAGGSPPDNAYDYETIDDRLIFESIPEVAAMYKNYLQSFLKLI